MLATLIPLFDENVAVRAYSLFAQKRNSFLDPGFLGTASYDGIGVIAHDESPFRLMTEGSVRGGS